MIVSIPTPTTSHGCSESPETRSLDDYMNQHGVPHWFFKDLELRDMKNDNVYEYVIEKSLKVYQYDPANNNMQKGDIVIKDGHHYEIISKEPIASSIQVPKEPEEYDDTETDMDNWESWAGRYFRTPLASAGSHLNWTVNQRTYYLFWSGDTRLWGCPKGHMWKIRDNTVPGTHYTMACLQNNHTWRYTPAKDIQGVKRAWSSSKGQSKPTFFPRSMVERGDSMYIRTWTDAPIQYKTITTISGYEYALSRIFTPAEIPGFKWKKKTNAGACFDDKNYTLGKFAPSSGKIDMSFVTTSETDTVAIGRVIAEKMSVVIRNSNNEIITKISDYPIDNSLGSTAFKQSVNVVLYSTVPIPATSKVNITFFGGDITVGRIMSGEKLPLGFTHTKFDNGFKDYSPKEQDQWGNIEYRNGVRVYKHSGTVDMKLTKYDMVNRAFMFIGGQEVIINSSDTWENSPPNSVDIFQATMMIGRFTSFTQYTKNTGSIMDSVAGYKFSIEESV